jgi:hypothetical protein
VNGRRRFLTNVPLNRGGLQQISELQIEHAMAQEEIAELKAELKAESVEREQHRRDGEQRRITNLQKVGWLHAPLFTKAPTRHV